MDTFRDFWVRTALLLALLLPVYFLVAAFGTKYHVFPWTVGFGQMTFVWGPRLLLSVAAFALLALLIAFFTPPRRGIGTALLALAIPALALGYAFYVRQQASQVPPIHDISTDLIEPPGFSQAVADERAEVPGGNGLDLLTKRTADDHAFIDMQRQSYPDIAPVSTGLDAAHAYAIALDLVREQKWSLGRTDAEAGVIEATVRSFWYGFTDDIAIRVRPDGTGARIDMRSVSRVGRSDLGANASRMRPFLQELRARLAQAEGAG